MKCTAGFWLLGSTVRENGCRCHTHIMQAAHAVQAARALSFEGLTRGRASLFWHVTWQFVANSNLIPTNTPAAPTLWIAVVN